MHVWLYRHFLLVLALLVGGLFTVQGQGLNPPMRVIGYFTYYSVYNEYLLTDVPLGALTHLYYGPVGISVNGQCESADEWADTGFKYPSDPENAREAGNFNQLDIIRDTFPDLKIIMTIGGWEESVAFSEIAADPDARVRLARSCLTYMREHNFDGIDIDWRYPVVGGLEPGQPEDMENYRALLNDFEGQIEYWNERDEEEYSLSITAPAANDLLEGFEPLLVADKVDWMLISTFGFTGAWSEITGHHAPLYGNPNADPRGAEVAIQNSFDGAINAYLDAGVPASKLVPGIGMYGQAWQNVRFGDLFGIYQFNGGAPDGTREGGVLYYRDITEILSDTDYTQYYDDVANAAWLYNQDRRIAISYENRQSIQAKLQYVRERRLGGVYLWQMSFDDTDHSITNLVSDTLLRRNLEDEDTNEAAEATGPTAEAAAPAEPTATAETTEE